MSFNKEDHSVLRELDEQPVRPMKLNDFFSLFKNREELLKWYDNPESWCQRVDELFNEPLIFSVSKKHTPKKELKNAFSELLAAYAEVKLLPTKVRRATVGREWKLYEHRILPLIDLTLWAEINNVEIKNRVLRGALYDDTPYLPHELKSKVYPWMELALDISFIEGLTEPTF